MPRDNYSGKGDTADGEPRQTEDEMQREKLGPAGVSGKADPVSSFRNSSDSSAITVTLSSCWLLSLETAPASLSGEG